jgi:hypothetical protein
VSEYRHEFTVKRSEWYRGRTESGSRLLRRDGQKCCVGFLCLSTGSPEKSLAERSAVHSLNSAARVPGWLAALFVVTLGPGPTDWGASIYSDNDSPMLSENERERRLTALFAEKGIKVTFVD